MSNFLDEIKKRIQVWHEQRAERIEADRQAALDAEAREAVQVMEFNSRWKSHTNLTHPGKYFRPSKVKIMRPTSPK